MDEKKSELMPANEHAAINLSSLMYDPTEDNLLVAALAVASTTELLVAIKAHVEKHSKKNCFSVIDLAGVAETLQVRGADSGYAVVKSPPRKVNAKGLAAVRRRRAPGRDRPQPDVVRLAEGTSWRRLTKPPTCLRCLSGG